MMMHIGGRRKPFSPGCSGSQRGPDQTLSRFIRSTRGLSVPLDPARSPVVNHVPFPAEGLGSKNRGTRSAESGEVRLRNRFLRFSNLRFSLPPRNQPEYLMTPVTRPRWIYTGSYYKDNCWSNSALIIPVGDPGKGTTHFLAWLFSSTYSLRPVDAAKRFVSRLCQPAVFHS